MSRHCRGAALATAYPRGDHQLEVGPILGALVLQGGDDLSHSLPVHNFLLFRSSRVAAGAPGGIMTQKATLHGIGEDAARRSVHALNGVLGEWLFGFSDDGLTELRVKGGEKVDDDLLVQADFSVRRYPLLTVILYFALKAA